MNDIEELRKQDSERHEQELLRVKYESNEMLMRAKEEYNEEKIRMLTIISDLKDRLMEAKGII
eukprot:706842-Hanusia_phi.AAC.1